VLFPHTLMSPKKKARTMKKAGKAKKMKKALKRRTVRKTVRKVKKVKKVRKVKKVKKVMKKKARASAARKIVIRKAAEKVIGKVVHYYNHIGVAVVALKGTLHQGDAIRLKRGSMEFTQTALSMQVNHTPIKVAKKGEEIGLKVDKVADEGTLILAA